MPREASDIARALGRLITVIQCEETRAQGSAEWAAAHGALTRAESLYWAAKDSLLGPTLAGRAVREYLGLEWLSRHPRTLPAIREVEERVRDFARQA